MVKDKVNDSAPGSSESAITMHPTHSFPSALPADRHVPQSKTMSVPTIFISGEDRVRRSLDSQFNRFIVVIPDRGMRAWRN